MGLPWCLLASDGKESTCNVGDLDSIPGSGRSPEKGSGGKIPWTEEPGSYSPWGHKESEMTEQLTLSLSLVPTYRMALRG